MSTDNSLLEHVRNLSRFMEALMLEREAYRLTLAEHGVEGWQQKFQAYMSDPEVQAFAHKAVQPFSKCIETFAEAAELLDQQFPAFDA